MKTSILTWLGWEFVQVSCEAREGETAAEPPPNPKPGVSTAPKPASLVASTTTVSTANATTPSTIGKQWVLLDTSTASEWNFQGCAVSGAAQGKCLDRVPALKDYWFDWRNYHPDTSIYRH